MLAVRAVQQYMLKLTCSRLCGTGSCCCLLQDCSDLGHVERARAGAHARPTCPVNLLRQVILIDTVCPAGGGADRQPGPGHNTSWFQEVARVDTCKRQ